VPGVNRGETGKMRVDTPESAHTVCLIFGREGEVMAARSVDIGGEIKTIYLKSNWQVVLDSCTLKQCLKARMSRGSYKFVLFLPNFGPNIQKSRNLYFN